MSASTQDEEAKRDEEQLERVMLRFAMADDEEKLSRAVASLLVPVLDKANSPIPNTKKKVGEVLTHVTRRLKAERSVTIPLLELTQQYIHESSSPLLRTCSLIFIELAFRRFPETSRPPLKDRITSLILLLSRVSEWQPNHRTTILHLALPFIDHLPTPKPEENHFVAKLTKSDTPTEAVSTIDSSINPTVFTWKTDADKQEMLSFLSDFLLLSSDAIMGLTQPAVSQQTSPNTK